MHGERTFRFRQLWETVEISKVNLSLTLLKMKQDESKQSIVGKR